MIGSDRIWYKDWSKIRNGVNYVTSPALLGAWSRVVVGAMDPPKKRCTEIIVIRTLSATNVIRSTEFGIQNTEDGIRYGMPYLAELPIDARTCVVRNREKLFLCKRYMVFVNERHR